jgi:hypothetical protein
VELRASESSVNLPGVLAEEPVRTALFERGRVGAFALRPLVTLISEGARPKLPVSPHQLRFKLLSLPRVDELRQ